jgi:PAS domain S-box-containing protein
MPTEDRKSIPTIFDCVEDGIFVHDIDTGAILDVNASMRVLYGYSREEARSLTVGDLSAGPPGYTNEDAKARMRAAAAGQPQLFEWHARRRNGELFWVEVNMRRATVDGSDRLVVVTRDISERRKTMEALRASEAFLDGIIEHSPYSTWISDENGTLVRTNQVLRDTLHVTDDDLVGRYNVFSDPLVIGQGLVPTIRRVFDQGDTVRFTMRYDSTNWQQPAEKKQSDLILDITISPVIDENGKTVHAIIQHFDITKMVHASETIQRLNAELERRVTERTGELQAALKELESFSYSISHDLRAPLRAIDGFAHILTDSQGSRMDAEGIRLCSLIRQNVRRMSDLIDALLAFARLGRADMRLAAIDMTAMVREVADELAPPPRSERMDLRLEPLPPALGDPVLLRQVWVNLVANALKFSSKRERAVIEVSGGIEEGEAVYRVRDNGTGFDMQFAGKLFGVFQRLHGDQEFEGTGVGLALAKRIIDRHGGRVWAEGKVDGGATFGFALPHRNASA